MLPPNTKAVLDASTWQSPPIFSWFQPQGNIAALEMARTFNCGLGMVVVVPKTHADDAIKLLQDHQESVQIVGEIATAKDGEDQVEINNLDRL